MARWGKCDFRQLQEFQKKIEKMAEADSVIFFQECAHELAARLLSKVINRTPVGDYHQEITVTAKRDGKIHKKGEQYTKKINPTGKVGGTLRRGWTAETEEEAESGKGKGKKAEDWANSLLVKKIGDTFQIEVTNPVHYASYVEYGHRQEPGRYVPALGKRLVDAWVPGKFMLTISEKELENELPKILENKITEFLKECF